MQTSGARGTILATGTYDTQAHPRVRVLIEGLRSHGWTVEEIVEPLRLDTASRVDVLKRPVLLPKLAVAVLRAWAGLVPSLLKRRRTAPRPDAVLVGYLGHFDVALVRRIVRPVPVVLDFLVSGASTAVDRGENGSLKQRALRAMDDFALCSADIVVVDTLEHAQAVPEKYRSRTVVVPVGADGRWSAAGLARRPPVHDGEPLSVVFFGLFTPLQGTPVIARALRELDGLVNATVIGAGQDDAEVDAILADVPGIVRAPWIDADALPGLVAQHDVCLGIFGTSDKAGRVVPNKVYQGAAAGCLVITSDTPPQRRALGSGAVYVPAGDAPALADALRRLAHDRPQLHDLSRVSAERARTEYSPFGTVTPLVTALQLLG